MGAEGASPDARRAISAARLTDVRKSFGEVRAVDGVSIDLRPGEVHALLGENGAGKTTLMKLLAGMVAPDAGTIEIAGEEVQLRDRRDGTRHGIGMIQQHFALIDELTAAENQLLGHPARTALADVKRASAELRETGERLGLVVDPGARVSELTMGERQRLEIVIALSAGAKVLIMDEPTAALGTADAALVAEVARGLAAQGTAVVYITHKLREVMDVSDRVSVMRRGRLVASAATRDTSADELADEMVESRPTRRPAHQPRELGEHVVSLRAVSVAGAGRRQGLEGVSISVSRGEIVGVAGVIGNGQDALAGVLTGLLEPSSGEVEPRPERVAYIPEDRAAEGLATGLSIRDNAIVHRHRDPGLHSWGRLASRPVLDFVGTLLSNAGIRVPGPAIDAGALSGGNQQRLVLAREFDLEPDLIVANNPYRGLDIGATADIRERLLDARGRGVGVLLISPDLDELFDISDRLVVLFEGRLAGELDAREAELREVGRLMAGAT